MDLETLLKAERVEDIFNKKEVEKGLLADEKAAKFAEL
jgi:hypothetical protein